MKAVVTVKLPRNPKHNPRNKKSGWCPINSKVWCSDITGSHHSYIEEGLNIKEIEEKARKKFKHITRIECFDEMSKSENQFTRRNNHAIMEIKRKER